jgi:hypothetical protein
MPKLKVGDRFNPYNLFLGSFIPDAIGRYRGISPGAKLAWGRFCRFGGERGAVFPSMETMGRETGCTINQARSYVKELIKENFIAVEERPGKPNTYYFLWHPAFDGEVGQHRMSPPLQDAVGVEDDGTPPGCCGGVPQDAGGVPLQDAGGESYSLESLSGNHGHFVVPVDPDTGEEIKPDPVYVRSKPRGQKGPKIRKHPGPEESRRRAQREAMFAEKETAQGSIGTVREVVGEPPKVNGGLKTPVIDFPARWNELVPEKPVQFWSNDIDGGLLQKAIQDVEFAPNFDRLCEKAREINRTSELGDWIDFQTALSRSGRGKGEFHWKRILRGNYDNNKKPAGGHRSMSEWAEISISEMEKSKEKS